MKFLVNQACKAQPSLEILILRSEAT